MQTRNIVIPALAALTAVCLFLVARPSTASPIITWSSQTLTQEVTAGTSTTTTLSFSSDQKLTDVRVKISGELGRIMTITPASLGTILPKQSVSLTLITHPAATSSPSSIPGTISLYKKAGDLDTPFGSPLPMTTKVLWPTTTTHGTTVTYPATWTLDQRSLDLSGPISLRNFPEYEYGGIRPRGGADMDVTRTPLPQSPLESVIATDLAGSIIDSTSSQQVGDVSATRVLYHDGNTPNNQERGIVVYVPFGGFLYKFFITYDLGDPNESEFLATFDGLVSSATLTAN